MSRFKQYMRSSEWRQLKSERRAVTGNCCEVCGRRGRLVGHHVNYPNDPYNCTVDDIEMICERCHNKLHAERSRDKNRRDHAGEELAILGARQAQAAERFEAVGKHSRSN